MIISIYEIKQKIGIQGDDLNSRDWGIEIRQEIEKQIHKDLQPSDDAIYLDFTEIKSFNSSIADEVIVLFMKKIINMSVERYLISQNIPDNSLYDLELVTAHRKIMCLIKQKNKKHPVIVYGESKSKKREVIDFIIYDYIMQVGKCTAREIADMIFKKDIYTASMYLSKLFKLRLLRRKELIDEQGKQFIYMPVA